MNRLHSFSMMLSAFMVFLMFTDFGLAQERANDTPRVSPTATVSQNIGTTIVTVAYGRPSVNEREIMGRLVPYGQRWRAGADEATAITFSNDVLIEGEHLSAGSYSIHTIPEEVEWTIILNTIHSWGTQYDPSGDVIRVTVTPESGPHMEQLMYYFEDVNAISGRLILHWANTRVPVMISLP